MEMGIDVLRKTSCSSELDNLACPDRYMKQSQIIFLCRIGLSKRRQPGLSIMPSDLFKFHIVRSLHDQGVARKASDCHLFIHSFIYPFIDTFTQC